MDTFNNICWVIIMAGMSVTVLTVAAWTLINVVSYYKFTKRTDDRLDTIWDSQTTNYQRNKKKH